MTALVITVVVVVLISAICSLLEAVLYSVPDSQVEAMAESGSRAGKVLRTLRGNIDQPITAILSLNTIANTAGAAVAGALATEALGEPWLPVFSGAFTLAILLFSEVMPKTVGVLHSRALAPLIALPLRGLVWLFRPLIWFMGLATRLFSRGPQDPGVSGEEIISLARVGSLRGVLDPEQATAIQNIVTMQDKSVSDVLTPRTVLFALQADMTCGAASKQERLFSHSRIPIYGKTTDDIVGIVLLRDILTNVAADRHERPLREICQPAEFVADVTSLGDALKQFLRTKRHMMVVINSFGGVDGVVTLEDVIEEMLGTEIVDEFDKVADMRHLAAAQAKARLSKKLK